MNSYLTIGYTVVIFSGQIWAFPLVANRILKGLFLSFRVMILIEAKSIQYL